MSKEMLPFVKGTLAAARCGDYAAAASLWGRAALGLEQELKFFSPTQQRELVQILKKILAQQEVEDWVGLADLLEYEFLPAYSH